jgi:hypothetical protein
VENSGIPRQTADRLWKSLWKTQYQLTRSACSRWQRRQPGQANQVQPVLCRPRRSATAHDDQDAQLLQVRQRRQRAAFAAAPQPRHAPDGRPDRAPIIAPERRQDGRQRFQPMR